MRLVAFWLVAALVALAVVPAPAEAPAGPLYYQRQHSWFGTYTPGYYQPVDTFGVPSSATLLCYVRWTVWDGSDHVATFRVTLKDGAGATVVLDAGGAFHLQDYGVNKVVVPLNPLKPNGNAFTPGAFTIKFEGEGFHGNWILQVYRIDSPSECGSLPP